jgi:predicted HTH domain antitoxin
MTITVSIPEEMLTGESDDVARQVLERVALEGFKSGQLTIAQVRRLLGFETRMQTHEFLADHGVPWVDYSVADAERERELLKKVLP